jgi:hypothetical protein
MRRCITLQGYTVFGLACFSGAKTRTIKIIKATVAEVLRFAENGMIIRRSKHGRWQADIIRPRPMENARLTELM